MTSPKARGRDGDYTIDGHKYPGYSRVSKTKRSFGLDWWLSGVTTAELRTDVGVVIHVRPEGTRLVLVDLTKCIEKEKV